MDTSTLLDGAAIEAIKDPVERLRQAGRTSAEATAALDHWRPIRNAAAVQMHREGASQAEVYLRTIEVSKTLWVRIIGSTEPGKYKNAKVTAQKAAAECRRAEQLVAEAQPIRNRTARGLMNGEWGEPMRNADVAALARFSPSRAASLRTERVRRASA